MSSLSIERRKPRKHLEATPGLEGERVFAPFLTGLVMGLLEVLALVLLSMGTLSFSACAFVSLNAQEFDWELVGDTWEEQADGIWSAPVDGAMKFAFSNPVRQDALSSILHVYTHDREYPVEKDWQDGTLLLSPASTWEPGRRYLVLMRGLLQAEDGRADPVDWSFVFVCQREEPFVLESVSPDDGALFDCRTGALPELQLSFSHQVDESSFAAAFSMDGFGTCRAIWNESGTGVIIRPEEGLMPQAWIRVPWRLSTALKDDEGGPLLEAASGSFVCEGFDSPPLVDGFFSAVKLDDEWVEAVDGLDKLREGEAPGVRFTAPMSPSSLENALYLRPSMTCHVVLLDAYRAVLLPQEDMEPASAWTFCVSRNARDVSGNPLGSAVSQGFMTEDRLFALAAIRVDDLSCEREGEGPWRGVLEGFEEEICVTLEFGTAFVAGEESSVVRSLRIDPLFPHSLAYPRVRAAESFGDRSIRFFITGMGRNDGASWYRLSLSCAGSPFVPDGHVLAGSWSLELELQP